ncbi:response regulator [Nocardioides jensenii]|uniref:response regulator n=1 Tax=Nocardioides jensenii TaxID=1843 RepID=UPI00082C20A2|nr:response regulator [Nocardioides jensenii]
MIRVLVVEDEELIAEAHRTFTERVEGFTCVGVAGTVRAAVQALQAHQAAGQPVDLVLLDLGLPDASGIEVAVASHHLRPAPDIIVISAARDLAVVRDAVSRGAALYLLKPFTFASFRERLESYRTFRESLIGPGARTVISQADVDRAVESLRAPASRGTSAKGAAVETSAAIARHLRDAGDGQTAAEVASSVGVSRVTAWRYLERLADDGLVTRDTEYGRAGRPQVRYSWTG